MEERSLSDELAELCGLARELAAWAVHPGTLGVPVASAGADTVLASNATTPRADEHRAARGPQQPRGASSPQAHELTARPRPPDAGSESEVAHRLTVLASEAAACVRCGLHEGRTRSVFARGNPRAEVMFIGEGPGYQEDQQGVPFVGPAGQLLDKMIEAMGYARDEVYICNVVKCRPPENRTPLALEAAACRQFLDAQIDCVGPRIIVALGRCAAEALDCVPDTGSWRGTAGQYRGIAVMPTYHPAFLLRSPHMKKPVWDDLQAVMASLGRTRRSTP